MSDPTYVKEQIEANPTWHVAWIFSEIMNDNAPIGWGRYISLARYLLEGKAHVASEMISQAAEQRGWEKAIEAAIREVNLDNISAGVDMFHGIRDKIRSLKYPGAALEHGSPTDSD